MKNGFIWIVGGLVVGTAVVGISIYLINKNKKKEEKKSESFHSSIDNTSDYVSNKIETEDVKYNSAVNIQSRHDALDEYISEVMDEIDKEIEPEETEKDPIQSELDDLINSL